MPSFEPSKYALIPILLYFYYNFADAFCRRIYFLDQRKSLFMRPIGKLAVFLAAVGVSAVPSAVAFESSSLISQQFTVPFKQLGVPSFSIDPSPVITNTDKNDETKAKTKTSTNKKDSADSNADIKKQKKKKKKKNKKEKKNKKPSYSTTPVIPTPSSEDKDSPSTTSPKKSNQEKKRRRVNLTLRKPTLLCRSFKKNDTLVRGFKARLYGRNTASVASGLRSNLNAYQSSGGNLSRCSYSGVISPSAFTKYFANRKPTTLIRESDNYSLPVYSSYTNLFAASGGRRSRFGLIATTPSITGSNGSRQMLKITANNALILFVDGRNQSLFKASPSRLPLRLISISPKVREVFTDASKSSLQRLVDFKKRKKASGKKSSLIPYLVETWRPVDLYPFSFYGLQKLGLLSNVNAAKVALLGHGLSGVLDSQQLLLAQVDPDIAAYCKDALDFSGCVETMQGSTEPAFPGSDASSSDDADSQYDDEYADGEYDDEYIEDEYAEGEYDEEYIEDEYAEGEDDEEYIDEDYADGEYDDEYFEEEYAEGDDDEFDDGTGMYPDDMGAPTAQACTGDTFGEQLACALVSALSTLLQQAFASN